MKTTPHGFLISIILLTLCNGTVPMGSAQTNRAGKAVVAWGGTVIPYVEPGGRYTAIAAGGQHSLALKPDGTIVAWGNGAGATLPVGHGRRRVSQPGPAV
jgi:hypothetical protein